MRLRRLGWVLDWLAGSFALCAIGCNGASSHQSIQGGPGTGGVEARGAGAGATNQGGTEARVDGYGGGGAGASSAGTAAAGTNNGGASSGGASSGGTNNDGVSGAPTTGSTVGGAGAGGSPSSGTEPNERERLVQFSSSLARAACEREVRCERLSTVERCIQWRNAYAFTSRVDHRASAAVYVNYFGGVDILDHLLSEYELADANELSDCVDALGDVECEAFQPLPGICKDALHPRTPRTAGQSCEPPSPYFADLPCQDGLRCSGGVCQPSAPSGEGDSCERIDDCEEGLMCLNLSCRVPSKLGEPCGSSCAEGVCVHGDEGATCVKALGLDEPCTDTRECQRDLDCEEGRCIAKTQLAGEPCVRNREGCLGFCVFDAPDAQQGTCGDPSFDAPIACSFYDSNPSMVCPLGYSASQAGAEQNEFGYPTRCECVP